MFRTRKESGYLLKKDSQVFKIHWSINDIGQRGALLVQGVIAIWVNLLFFLNKNKWINK